MACSDGFLIEEFPVSDGPSGAYGNPTCKPSIIAAGPDGGLWLTRFQDRIGRITTDGDVTEFCLPRTGIFPSAIARGPDSALWFTLNQANALGRISTAGEISLFPLSTPNAAPVGIAPGNDGALWP